MKDQVMENRVQANTSKISAKNAQVYYGANHAIKDVDVEILDRTVTAFIGPSGCGKSTFLRCLNRMNDTIDGLPRGPARSCLDADDIYDPLDRRGANCAPVIGMVFQKPNPFPKSIYENVAYGPQASTALTRTKADTGRDRRIRALRKRRPVGTR